MNKVVFLGGTCGNNDWREERVIPALLERGVAPGSCFNPVVAHWDKLAQEREDAMKESATYLLFVIANPDKAQPTANVSAYSLIEAVQALYDKPERTVVVFDMEGMPKHTAKAISKGARDLQQRFPGAPIFTEYEQAMEWLAERLAS